MNVMMADGWDEEDAPANCEVQVELRFEDFSRMFWMWIGWK